MNWTEDERVKVCQHLATVMEFVRLLLIDSQVFAEEVEPTGNLIVTVHCPVNKKIKFLNF